MVTLNAVYYTFPSLMLILTLELGTTQDTTSRVDQARTVDELLNKCIDGRNHKSQPGEESSLMSFCSPWKKRSCCTQETAEEIHHDENWLNFDRNHCGELSPSCREFFIKDLCFYECSPNVGPWIVPESTPVQLEEHVKHLQIFLEQQNGSAKECGTTALKWFQMETIASDFGFQQMSPIPNDAVARKYAEQLLGI
ncbi:hypothetical protein C0Q70_06067 [Pomacea canaliculata]|uniref:Folate receptor-like domain-containing protein n=1 Tax=Pomacea canaliculata TaxID=400727 RepID=A0A2T7PMZ6_POMCA|nr:hypothetical protein C0Q70_06067 [Pomacea canaliculata]